MRILLDEEGELLGRPPSEHAISQATHEGIISSECYFLLTEAVRRRDALVNGFGLDETDADAVREVVDRGEAAAGGGRSERLMGTTIAEMEGKRAPGDRG